MMGNIAMLARIIVVSIILALLTTTVAVGEEIKIDGQSIVFLYEARAENRIPDEQLAEKISIDFRNARDEFTRHELMESIKPVIEKRMAAAASAKEVYLLVKVRLGDYDFEKNAFSTTLGEGTYIRYGERGGYAVSFVNGEETAFLPVPMESARALAGELRRDRRATLKISAEPVRAKRKGFIRRPNDFESYTDWRKTLEIMVSRIEATLDSGTAVAAADVKARPDLVKTCEEIVEECSTKYVSCKEGCKEIEDLFEETRCFGRCELDLGDLKGCARLEGC